MTETKFQSPLLIEAAEKRAQAKYWQEHAVSVWQLGAHDLAKEHYHNARECEKDAEFLEAQAMLEIEQIPDLISFTMVERSDA